MTLPLLNSRTASDPISKVKKIAKSVEAPLKELAAIMVEIYPYATTGRGTSGDVMRNHAATAYVLIKSIVKDLE